ncbi:autotransporter domain-containing protein [Brucella intermedia]|uniref:autotransporter domain-containing protein n=1 Tax=Brucella intermedia TaxID=94625 RepID=UPI002248A417|nr:autotransporter domain-containing protein [Brucella intermedia]
MPVRTVSRARSLLLGTTALAVVLSIGAAARPALAQSVTVTGSVEPNHDGTSDWEIDEPLTLGSGSTLAIMDGGRVSGTHAFVDGASGLPAVVVVSGAGSIWENKGFIDIGVRGDARLVVENGGAVTSSTGYIGLDTGSTGTAVVSGANSTWHVTYNLYVGDGGTGTLSIDDGGAVFSEQTHIGTTGTGTLNLLGNANERGVLETGFVAKGSGQATLNLDGGILRAAGDQDDFLRGFGALTAGAEGVWFDSNGYSITVGPDTSFAGSSSFNKIGQGTLKLTGDSSSFTGDINVLGGTLDIANKLGGDIATVSGADARLTVTNGGNLSSSQGYISNGSALVSGTGSSWNNTGRIYVGRTSSGTLTIADGGRVDNTVGYIGYESGAGDSSVTVSGTDMVGNASTWHNSAALFVGLNSRGTLTILDGGRVENTYGHIGYDSGSGGSSVTVSGTDTAGNASTWHAADTLNVGYISRGTLTIADGGRVENTVGVIGTGIGSGDSSVTVSGAGTAGHASTWHNSGLLAVGNLSRGTLTIEGGGRVENTDGIIGNGTGSTGSSVTVSGTDTAGNASTWHNSDILYVGNTSRGALTIVDGGRVENADGYIGYGTGAAGSSVTVSGTDSEGNASTWVNFDTLVIGYEGSGELTIAQGGRVENTDGYIGILDNSSVTVSGISTSGNASTWHNAGNLYVGYNSNGTLTIADGGRVENADGYIGNRSDATGSSVIVSGTDTAGQASTWDNLGTLSVGYQSRGTLTIAGGGRVENTYGSIGTHSGTAGSSVTVSGTDTDGNSSTWHNSHILVVGHDSSAMLTIADGGRVLAGDGAGGAGTVHLGINASGTLNIGTATGPADAKAGTLVAAQVEFNGNSTLNFNHVEETVFSAALESAGTGTHAVNHLGGTTTLTGDSSGFSGTTTVSGGTLLVGDAAGNGTLGGIVNVDSDGTLGGSGTLTGDVTIDGRLSAGNSPGMLTFDNDLTLNAGSTSVFELNSPGIIGGSGNDLIVVNGMLTLDGTLEAHVAAAGFYQLFDYSGGTLAAGSAFSTTNITSTEADFTPASHSVYYDSPGQVNLSVLDTGQNMQFWDGAYTTGDGIIDGGNGVWSSGLPNWTGGPGSAEINGPWGGSVGVFRGTAGTVTVNGAQSFDTLQFSTDGYVVQGDELAIGVAGGGSFNIDGGVSTTIGSVIQDGAGSALRKAGSGTLILTADNTYSGGTSLLGGTVSVSADANLGAVNGGLGFNGGSLQITGTSYTTTDRAIAFGENGGGFDIVDASNSFTLAQDITGSGDLVKQGAGTLVLTGANDYGNTLVQAGTLVGNAGSISGTIGNAGTLVFEQVADARFAGDITGLNGTSGEMVKQGAGILTLDGTSQLDWTIESGSLVSAAERFGGNADIWTGTSLTFDQTQAAIYGGVLTGSGDFSVAGTGVVALTGDSSAFAGTTTITGNNLIVGQNGSGALGGDIVVQSNGLLGGTGAVGSAGSTVSIASGGVHAPGNSIGVQHVAGDYVNNGTLQIEANPTAADRIVVAGSVDITGATLDLLLSPVDAASWNVFSGPFTIIDKQSAGAVVGTFDPVTQNLLFLDALLDYAGGDGNDVTLALERNYRDFASVGQTPNQIATGTGVESLGNTNPVWASIAMASDQDVVRASFDALSGEVHASAKTALIEDSRFVRNAINDRIRAAFDNAGASYTPVLAYGPGDNPVLVSADHSGPVFWSQGFGSWGSTDSDGNAAGLDRSTGGLLVGTDGLVGDWRIGLLAGYSHSTFEANDRASSGSSNNYHLGLYGGTQWGDLALRTGAAYTWHDIETGRTVAIPGISEGLSAGYDAGTFQAFGELGYGIDLGDTRLEPFANLAHVSLHSNGFTEQGGTSALHGGSSTTDVTFTTLGLRAEHALALGSVDATLRGMVGWRHAFGDTRPTSTHAFATGDAFTIAGVPIAEDAAVIEAGLDLSLTPQATFGVSYQGQLSGSVQDHGFKANLNVRF